MGFFKTLLRPFGKKSFAEPPFWTTDQLRFPFWGPSLGGNKEPIENNFCGYVQGAYKSDGIVFAAITARSMVFSEARFQWRTFSNGRPNELFGTPELGLLENPWPNGTTGELLAHMEQDASLAGNFFATVVDDNGNYGKAATGPGRRIVRLRPDWVEILIASPNDDYNSPLAKIVGYIYKPTSGANPGVVVTLTPDQVCHYSPIPDPEARFRGMSWLTPVLREIQADKAATHHKAKFFENGATPNLVIKFEPGTAPDKVKEFAENFKADHEGAHNAYGTLFLAGGADVTVVGKDFQQLDFKATQGTSETRIAAAGRVHPVILGISEGLAGSSLNAGNFSAARRNFVDGTIRPLWRIAAASLQSLVTPPNPGATLWYDDRDVAFLREDATDIANIHQIEAATMRQLVDGGFDPTSVIAYVATGDVKKLVHTGNLSVQLQPPGTTQDTGQVVSNGP